MLQEPKALRAASSRAAEGNDPCLQRRGTGKQGGTSKTQSNGKLMKGVRDICQNIMRPKWQVLLKRTHRQLFISSQAGSPGSTESGC